MILQMPQVPALSPPVQASIRFARSPDGDTCIQRQQVGYPFHLGRVLRLPESPPGMASVYLQSCSGGIFEGEDLGLDLHVGQGACAHLSTGASTVVHGMRERGARQRVRIEVEAGALFEYLPKPTLLFPHADLHSRVDVVLHPGASLLLCDSCLGHEPDGKDIYFDKYLSTLRISRPDGRLLLQDRMQLSGKDLKSANVGMTGTYQTLASLFILNDRIDTESILKSLRSGVLGQSRGYAAASELPSGCGIWVRALSHSAVDLQYIVNAIWQNARNSLGNTFPTHANKPANTLIGCGST
ncbi:urease accessory protein UreD [Pseudomonas lopnurensis]|uniref:urease accessory protein UreD n=1 Tax=Pseudomonas lopnurensis TaxID=1477517 RepID=UPI0028B0847E|nr:urease accessory protein UreD [Pseudomonas lopnurensis]